MRANEINLHLAIANNLFSNTAHFGGCSINSNFESPKTGYLVSVKDGLTFNSQSEVNEHEISIFVKENLPLCTENNYFGGWKDQQTKKQYFDLSLNTQSFDFAIQVAIQNKQLAIWDLNENKEIRVN